MIEHQYRSGEVNSFIRALPGVFDAIEASDEVRDAFVFAAWRYVAGEQTADRTSPLQVDGKKLIVAVEDRTWKRNLESLAPQLLFRLDSMLGRSLIDLIEFRVDPAPIRRREHLLQDGDDDDASALTPRELTTAAERIKDPVLRDNVLRAAGACLSRKHSYSYLESDSLN
jgi:hypothetical protein